jgi:hypothetical protein
MRQAPQFKEVRPETFFAGKAAFKNGVTTSLTVWFSIA